MKDIFQVETINDTFLIKFKNFNGLPFNKPSGSYNILKARIFNLPYGDYLRVARDQYGATLKGQTGYITELFFQKKDAEKLCKELNIKWNQIFKGVKK